MGRIIRLGGRFALLAAILCLVKIAPQSVQITRWLQAGDEAARDEDYDRAAAAYSRLLRYRTMQPVVYARMVQMSLDADHLEDARVYLFALADRDGWTEARREQLALVLESSGETAQAALASGSSELSQDDPVMLHRLARQQIGQLDWPQARATLEKIIHLNPDDSEALYLLGLLLAPQDRLLAAGYLLRVAPDSSWADRAQTVQVVLDTYPRYALTDAHTYLGATLAGLGEWPFAEQALEMALVENQVNPTAWAYLGFVRDQQGRDGLPDLESALAMAPNDPTVQYFLGQHWRLAGEYSASYDAFSQAYWLDPANPALAAEVATSLQLLGDLSSAEEWFRVAVDLAPDDPRWMVMLAAFYADTGFELDTVGLAYIEQAAQQAPDDADIHASLGWVYYQSGDITGAYDELNRALSLDPSHVRSRYYFGVVLEALGDRQGAADSYWFVVQQAGSDKGLGALAARALERLGYAPESR